MNLAELNRQRRLSRMRRAVVTAGQLHSEAAPKGARAAMITLTYRPDAQWRRQHISECLAMWRKELRKHRFRYVWVMELTRAGKPHYHVLVWLPKGTKLQKPDISGAWPWGMSKIEWARNAVGYLVKYASKGNEDWDIPRGARIYGVGGLKEEAREILRWAILPLYIREQVEPSDQVTRSPGGGWVSKVTGTWFPAIDLRECYAS